MPDKCLCAGDLVLIWDPATDVIVAFETYECAKCGLRLATPEQMNAVMQAMKERSKDDEA